MRKWSLYQNIRPRQWLLGLSTPATTRKESQWNSLMLFVNLRRESASKRTKHPTLTNRERTSWAKVMSHFFAQRKALSSSSLRFKYQLSKQRWFVFSTFVESNKRKEKTARVPVHHLPLNISLSTREWCEGSFLRPSWNWMKHATHPDQPMTVAIVLFWWQSLKTEQLFWNLSASTSVSKFVRRFSCSKGGKKPKAFEIRRPPVTSYRACLRAVLLENMRLIVNQLSKVQNNVERYPVAGYNHNVPFSGLGDAFLALLQ